MDGFRRHPIVRKFPLSKAQVINPSGQEVNMKGLIIVMTVLLLLFSLTGFSPAENKSTTNIPSLSNITIQVKSLFSPSARENGVLSTQIEVRAPLTQKLLGPIREHSDQAPLECPSGCEMRCHWNGYGEWVCTCVCRPMM